MTSTCINCIHKDVCCKYRLNYVCARNGTCNDFMSKENHYSVADVWDSMVGRPYEEKPKEEENNKELNDYKQPIMSALLIYRSANLKCPNFIRCSFCEYSEFCNKLHDAYVEALKILPIEVIENEVFKDDQ